MTPEGKLKKEVDEYLTRIGAFFWKPVCKNKGNVGVFADGACEICYADQGEKRLKEKL